MSKQDAGDDTPAPQPFERKSNYQVRPFTKADYECMDRVNDIFIRNVAIGAFCGCTPGAAFAFYIRSKLPNILAHAVGLVTGTTLIGGILGALRTTPTAFEMMIQLDDSTSLKPQAVTVLSQWNPGMLEEIFRRSAEQSRALDQKQGREAGRRIGTSSKKSE